MSSALRVVVEYYQAHLADQTLLLLQPAAVPQKAWLCRKTLMANTLAHTVTRPICTQNILSATCLDVSYYQYQTCEEKRLTS